MWFSQNGDDPYDDIAYMEAVAFKFFFFNFFFRGQFFDVAKMVMIHRKILAYMEAVVF